MKPLSIKRRRKVYRDAALDYETHTNRFTGMCYYLAEPYGGPTKVSDVAWGYIVSHSYEEIALFAFDQDHPSPEKHWSYEFHFTMAADRELRATILLFAYYMTF
jgi:hypothetical protein